jgi:hypothetical protein
VSDLPADRPDELLPAKDDLPPVVARLVVEIRSDGTRTVARGGLEDVALGQKVALQAEAGSPLELSRLLLRSMVATPLDLLRTTLEQGRQGGLRDRLRRLLPGPPPRPEQPRD